MDSAAHSLRDRTDTPAVALEELPGVRASGDERLWRLTLGGVGTATRVTSALVELEDPFSAPVVSSLPPVFRLAGAGAGQTLLVEHLRLLAREIESRPLMRMQRATMLLREGATLALTSQLTGYASEASFSHAFRQWSGMAPGAYRRQQHERQSEPRAEPGARPRAEGVQAPPARRAPGA
ncbi:helix-turn-helix domain-containing protein [Sorangium sp. So ce118]